MRLCTLGTSHGATEPGRSCSGNLLTVNGKHYLFDCGGDVERKAYDLGIPLDDLKAVFITHMHVDHVANLASVVKRFWFYLNHLPGKLEVFMPEEEGISAFKGWMYALHSQGMEQKTNFSLVNEGVIYSDENVKVTAIRTRHVNNGKFPSFAYMVEASDKRFLYTGDLNYSFDDYPEILYKEKFDAVLCELVHFDVDKNMDCFLKTNTKQLIFTHLGLHNIPKIESVKDRIPYPVHIARDNAFYHI